MSHLMTNPTKWHVQTDQPGHTPSPIRVFAVCIKKAWVFSYPSSTQRRLGSDWADAQADLCLCWGLTSQSTIFQSWRDGATASWVINQYFRGVKCLAQGLNTAAVALEPPTSHSGVRHSTTEPPRSPQADLSLRWAQSHFVGFVMRWLISCITSALHSMFPLSPGNWESIP